MSRGAKQRKHERLDVEDDVTLQLDKRRQPPKPRAAHLACDAGSIVRFTSLITCCLFS